MALSLALVLAASCPTRHAWQRLSSALPHWHKTDCVTGPIVTRCATVRPTLDAEARPLHNRTKGSRHGLGARGCPWALLVHLAHIAAELSSIAMALTSLGQTSRMSILRPALSTKVRHWPPSCQFQVQLIRRAVMMQAPAGPATLDHMGCMPTCFCCWNHASRRSSTLAEPSHTAVAQASNGAASHSCWTSALFKARRRW